MIKLYDKKLNSMDALKQEIALKKLEEQNYFNNILGTDNTGQGDLTANTTATDNDTDWSEMLGIGIDLLTSKGLSNKLMALAVPAISLIGNKIEKNVLKSFAKEFAVGYLKWKALELGTKALFSFIDSRMEKKKED